MASSTGTIPPEPGAAAFEPAPRALSTQCCIAGGGPAGMMLGYLLARAGVDVVVLEKHADFLRDFRGDTIHPSTLELMHELGLLDAFLALPHRRAERLGALIGDARVTIADFTRLRGACRFLVLMPQWDFLDFLAAQGTRYGGFRLMMSAAVTGLTMQGGVVAGVKAATAAGPVDITAPLVVGCDGRHSTIRSLAGLEVTRLGAPMDVLWMRLSRRPSDGADVFGRFEAGRIFIMIDRGDYWQCAFVIPKGAAEDMRRRDIADFRREVLVLAPFLGERVGELASWDDVKLLTVELDRLRKWYRPGVLCIGDAAHAMSPVGGVGINLAIQDAVAAANVLAGPLRAGSSSETHLRRIQVRRTFPTRMTQALQRSVQDRIISRVLGGATPTVPLAVRMLQWFPALQGIPARVIGIGVRPEHVQTQEDVAAQGRGPA